MDGADRACSKLREMMHAEAKASLKAWRTTQTALKREQRRNKLSTQNKNATATLIHKSVRKHSTKPLSRRNERRITALNDELRAQRKRLATLHRHMTHTEPHKAPYCRVRSEPRTVEPWVSRPDNGPDTTTVNALVLSPGDSQQQRRALIDGGASMFITANEELFIPGTLRPTDYRVRGLDRKLHRADASRETEIRRACMWMDSCRIKLPSADRNSAGRPPC